MGFALWNQDGLYWAVGTHEYRPMGVAIIAASDYFRMKDFRRQAGVPSRDRRAFVGFFASIDHLNLQLKREKKAGRKLQRGGLGAALA